MQHTNHSLFLLFPLLATLLLNVAHAASIFNNREQWEAAAGTPVITIDFSTRDNGTPISVEFFDVTRLTLRGVTFTPTAGTFRLQFHSLTFGPQRPLRAMLPSNTTAVGMNLRPVFRTSVPYTISLSTGETFSVDSSLNGTSPIFFGIKSAAPLEWVTVYHHLVSTKVDNFTFVAGSVSHQPSSGTLPPAKGLESINSTRSPAAAAPK